jgi:hypothetical protein
MSFEFMYSGTWYQYNNGKLLKQNSCGTYIDYLDDVCPVLMELQDQLEAIPEDVRPVVMQGLLHAYGYGIIEGKNKKIAEFKRVFKLD